MRHDELAVIMMSWEITLCLWEVLREGLCTGWGPASSCPKLSLKLSGAPPNILLPNILPHCSSWHYIWHPMSSISRLVGRLRSPYFIYIRIYSPESTTQEVDKVILRIFTLLYDARDKKGRRTEEPSRILEAKSAFPLMLNCCNVDTG